MNLLKSQLILLFIALISCNSSSAIENKFKEFNCYSGGTNFPCVYVSNGPIGVWELYTLNGVISGAIAILIASSHGNPAPIDFSSANYNKDNTNILPRNDGMNFIGFDRTGDNRVISPPDQLPVDTGNGYLDASDSFSAFQIDADTDITLVHDISANRETIATGHYSKHSFWLASTGDFDVFASATTSSSGALGAIVLNNINMRYFIKKSGSTPDTGSVWGGSSGVMAGSNLCIRTSGNVSDITPGPLKVLDCQRISKLKNADSFKTIRQAIRVYSRFQLPTYDLSTGTGQRDIRIKYQIRKP
jgi:hypothetical protein